jgi:hypothetical protein
LPLLTNTISVTNFAPWVGVTNWNPHLGQINLNPDGFLYATLMDTIGFVKTALLKINPTNLSICASIDLSSYADYVDSLAFSPSNRIWIPKFPDKLVSLDWSSFVVTNETGQLIISTNQSSWNMLTYQYNTTNFSVPQGLQVRNGYAFIVPENDATINRTPIGNNGIVAFRLSTLSTTAINNPAFVFPFETIPGSTDLEAFDFDPVNPSIVYIPDAAFEGRKVYKLELGANIVDYTSTPGTLTIHTQTVDGVQFNYQSSTNLFDWTDLQPYTLTGNGDTISITITNFSPSVFFRVVNKW